MKCLKSLLWAARPLRVLVESWLACAVVLALLIPAYSDATLLARSLFLVLLPLFIAGWSGLRLRRSTDSPVRAILKECGVALALTMGLFGIIFGIMNGLWRPGAIPSSIGGLPWPIISIALAFPEYLGFRGVGWLWRYFNSLRRRRYVWGLTHSILVVVGGIGMLVLAGLVVYLARLFKNDIWQIPPDSVFALAVFWLVLVLVLAFLLVIIGVALFLPPAVLFSFLVARRMTARLETLATATQALRKGDLSKRVAVQGEDEVAQLQADFNGMAADLEQSVQALEGEKEKVWGLMEARRELVAGVSHELRNPTATILGYTDSLRRTWKEHSPEEVESDLETIQYEASRLQTILNDLLAASQLEVGRLRVALQAVEVNALAQRLVDVFSGLAWGSKRVQVTLSAPETAVYALADPLRLEQVLVNLIQNALRHTSPGGLVAVEVVPGNEQVYIEVEDTGEGIAPEDLPHIWEAYYQGGSVQHGANGIGLGLSLVKELTEAMGGSVSVESWHEQGSVFRVHLPVCPDGSERPV